MGFGITGLVNAVTSKALIRYVPADKEKTIAQYEEEYGISGFGQYAVVGSLASLVGDIKQVTPDVRKSESLRLQSEITEYALEDGSIVAQHIIQRPLEVTLVFEETNAGKFASSIMGAALDFIGMAPQSLYDQLFEIWKDKIQCEIITDQDIYKNMAVSSMPIMQKAPYKGAYQVMCSFTQITKAVPEVMAKRGKTPGLQKAASALIKGGKQVLQNIQGE